MISDKVAKELRSAVDALRKERDELDEKIVLMEETLAKLGVKRGPGRPPGSGAKKAGRKKKAGAAKKKAGKKKAGKKKVTRHWSPEARAAAAARKKKWWAEKKKQAKKAR